MLELPGTAWSLGQEPHGPLVFCRVAGDLRALLFMSSSGEGSITPISWGAEYGPLVYCWWPSRPRVDAFLPACISGALSHATPELTDTLSSFTDSFSCTTPACILRRNLLPLKTDPSFRCVSKCPQKRMSEPQELESQVVVSYLLSAGNWKSNRCS